jgi:hypothetical protein
VLAQAGCLLALAATSWAAGWVAWGSRSSERLLHPLTSTIGLAVLGVAGLALAALHLFEPWVLAVCALTAHAAAARGWRLVATAAATALRQPRRALAGAAIVVAALTGSFGIALLPPTGFDETTYHLPLARAFLERPGLPWVPELRAPAFPLLAEALQATLLALGGERAQHQVALFATLTTAALLLVWGREAAGEIAGWLAAALYLGSPLVAYLGGTGYIDPLLGLFSTGAFYAIWRARNDGAAWAWTAGSLAGAAAAVKYLGFYTVVAGALAAVVVRGARGRRLIAFGVAATLVAALPYGYLLWRTGNPVFPYLSSVFGNSPWSPELGGFVPEHDSTILSLPYNSVFRRELTGNQPPLSPALLLGAVVLAPALLRLKCLRAGVLVVAGFFLAYTTVPVVSRYLLVVLPLWALLVGVAASWGWSRLRGAAPPRSLAAALAVAIVLPGAAYGPFFVAQRGGIPTSPRARDAYLAEAHPGYRALAWLQARERRYVAFCLDCERLHGLATGRLLGEQFGPWSFHSIRSWLNDPATLEGKMKATGATHLLLPRSDSPALRSKDAAARFERLHADGEFEVWGLRPARRGGAG